MYQPRSQHDLFPPSTLSFLAYLLSVSNLSNLFCTKPVLHFPKVIGSTLQVLCADLGALMQEGQITSVQRRMTKAVKDKGKT